MQATTEGPAETARKDAIVRSLIALRTRMTAAQARAEVLLPPEPPAEAQAQPELQPADSAAVASAALPLAPQTQLLSAAADTASEQLQPAADPEATRSGAKARAKTSSPAEQQQPAAKRQRIQPAHKSQAAASRPLPAELAPAASAQASVTAQMLDDVFGSSDDEAKPAAGLTSLGSAAKPRLDPSIKQKLLAEVRSTLMAATSQPAPTCLQAQQQTNLTAWCGPVPCSSLSAQTYTLAGCAGACYPQGRPLGVLGHRQGAHAGQRARHGAREPLGPCGRDD